MKNVATMWKDHTDCEQKQSSSNNTVQDIKKSSAKSQKPPAAQYAPLTLLLKLATGKGFTSIRIPPVPDAKAQGTRKKQNLDWINERLAIQNQECVNV